MSYQKASKITSKIDSGLPNSKKPSVEFLPMKTRQPSQMSRSSSHQSNPNLTERKRFSTSTTRPNTSSLPPAVGIVDDSIQRGVHKLGQRPRYLQQSQKRPATVGGSSRRMDATESTEAVDRRKDSEREAVRRVELGRSGKSKDVLDGIFGKPKKEHKVVRRASEVRREDTLIPLAEGCGDMAILLEKELQLVETRDKMQELEQLVERQEEEHRKRLQELEAEIEIKALVIKQQEEEIAQLKKQLVKAGIALQESQTEIFELTEKATDADWLKDCLQQAEAARRSSEEQTNKLQEEISKRNEEEISKRNEEKIKEEVAKQQFDQDTAEFEKEILLFNAKWCECISSFKENFTKIASFENEDEF